MGIAGTTESFFDSLEQMFELTHRVLCDTPPLDKKGIIKANLAYLYGQAPPNELSVLKTGVGLSSNHFVDLVAVCGAEAGHGYNGGEAWSGELQRRGVSPDRIIKIMRVESKFPPSTDSEADGLMAELAKPQWESAEIIVCASPMHQIRAFVSTISAMRRNSLFRAIYNVAGKPLPWLENTVHSQGTDSGLRKDLLITGELARLNKYSNSEAKVPLLKARDVLAYLDERDNQ